MNDIYKYKSTNTGDVYIVDYGDTIVWHAYEPDAHFKRLVYIDPKDDVYYNAYFTRAAWPTNEWIEAKLNECAFLIELLK